MMAANEGLFLDPVYTGKAFAGLIKLAAAQGKFKSTDNVLYLYSGGAWRSVCDRHRSGPSHEAAQIGAWEQKPCRRKGD